MSGEGGDGARLVHGHGVGQQVHGRGGGGRGRGGVGGPVGLAHTPHLLQTLLAADTLTDLHTCPAVCIDRSGATQFYQHLPPPHLSAGLGQLRVAAARVCGPQRLAEHADPAGGAARGLVCVQADLAVAVAVQGALVDVGRAEHDVRVVNHHQLRVDVDGVAESRASNEGPHEGS